MSKMRKTLLMGAMMICMMVPSLFVSGAQNQQEAEGRTFYVDSVNGKDDNDGLSKERAFQSLSRINEQTLRAGDKVLLKKGSVFHRQYLHLEKEGGTAGNPVVIGTYGEGSRPVIHTMGEGRWYQSYNREALDNPKHKSAGWVSSAIRLIDVEYIEISGLEITNTGGSNIAAEHPTGENLEYNHHAVMNRTGVAGVAKDRGTLEHIVLRDLYIHDVIGNVYDKHMVNGGIYFIMAVAEDESKTGIPKYDNLVIENCHIENVNRWGIAAAYSGAHSTRFQNTAAIDAGEMETYGCTNVIIRNNYLKGVGGDAITTMYCYRPLVEHNVSIDAAAQINLTDYSKGEYGSFGRVAAAIWPWKCKDAVFQYNECYDTQNAGKGNGDGQAWDADSGDGTLYQYNYSSGNTGGTVMFCLQQAVHSTFRYNISQNDLIGILNLPGNPDAHIYNNTFYIKEGVPIIRTDMRNGAAKMENNIFYYSGTSPKEETWYYNEATQIYHNNLYYNYAQIPKGDAKGIRIDADAAVQILKNPGSAPSSAKNKGPGVYERSAFEGYLPAEGSPVINQGVTITDANGFAVEKDFFGKQIGEHPEIGAAESDSPSLMLTSGVYQIVPGGMSGINTIGGIGKETTVEMFLKNVVCDSQVTITVLDGNRTLSDKELLKPGMTVKLSWGERSVSYTVLQDTDASLHGSIFKQTGKEIYVPSTEQNPCTPETLLAGVEFADTASARVYSGQTEVTEGALTDGMTLCITAQDGVTTEAYTIRIQNEYDWIKDYVEEKQGEVWFAQYKDGAADYVNFSNYSNQYAVWQIADNRYDNVGAQGRKGSVTEESHGLIIDFSSDDGFYTYMAFRVPMSGRISFELRADEPYLRQNNTRGSAQLTLYHNETEIQSCEMSRMNVKATFERVELTVKKGDWIRLRAAAINAPNCPSIYATPIIRYLDVSPTDM
ncbi:MAG: right-handed parallel beta-helix repeat-containing protein [Clostridiales bacterium]|nr:right-handed parallel beta-helix repeat-containing protein [Clostridiales bacterium]